MGLTLAHSIHTGVRIENYENGNTIDVIVRAIDDWDPIRIEIADGEGSRFVSLYEGDERSINEEVNIFYERGKDIHRRRSVNNLLENIKVASLFIENSTRTNFSSRAAVGTAGGFVDGFPSKEYTSLQKGETWGDTAAMFASWGYDVIVMRSTTEGLPRWTKEYLNDNHKLLEKQHQMFNQPFSYRVPMIINGGDGKNQHPTQCLIDLMTMQEVAKSWNRNLDGLSVALTNDIGNSRVQTSLITAAHLFDWTLHFAYAARFGPNKNQLAFMENMGIKYHDHGMDLETALREAELVCHSRPQKERVSEGKDLEMIKSWGMITNELYEKLGKDAPFLLHPRPVDSETFEEIHHSMRFHPKNISGYQAANGLYLRIALPAIGIGRMKMEYLPRMKERKELTLYDGDLSNKPKELTNPRSGFIKENGIVIDHIPAGMGRRLEGILGFEGSSLPVVLASNIPVAEGRSSSKDILKIHDSYKLSKEQYEAIALFDGSVAIVKNGEVEKKIQPVIGNSTKNRIKCGNEPCVTNIRKEHVESVHHIQKINGEKILHCHHCGHTDTIISIYKENRFKYIGEE